MALKMEEICANVLGSEITLGRGKNAVVMEIDFPHDYEGLIIERVHVNNICFDDIGMLTDYRWTTSCSFISDLVDLIWAEYCIEYPEKLWLVDTTAICKQITAFAEKVFKKLTAMGFELNE